MTFMLCFSNRFSVVFLPKFLSLLVVVYSTSTIHVVTVSGFIVPERGALNSASLFSECKNLKRCHRQHQQQTHCLLATPQGSEDDDEALESPLDAMRRLLESSWNAETMGRIPADPIEGANEAYSSIMKASMDQKLDAAGIFFVDILLPSYDVTQGDRMYDEVVAVEYCISLAKCLKGKTEILVRDDKTIQTVEKILNARERYARDSALGESDDDDDDDDEEEDEEEVVEEDDDEEDLSFNDQNNASLDVDSFRQNLISNWDGDTESKEDDGDNSASCMPPPNPQPSERPLRTPSGSSRSKAYRLACLFGNDRIPAGADMSEDVIRAVRNNALAAEDEENIIILNAVGQDETIAVRALVTKYKGQKKIILVNCLFHQMPRELSSAETVYSVLPLIAKEKKSNDNVTRKDIGEDDGPPPKVVVLRRFPKDWEIFVDVGSGFKLADTVPLTQGNKRGLPMDHIARCVKRYLESISPR